MSHPWKRCTLRSFQAAFFGITITTLLSVLYSRYENMRSTAMLQIVGAGKRRNRGWPLSTPDEKVPPYSDDHNKDVFYLTPDVPINKKTVRIPHPTATSSEHEHDNAGAYSKFRCSGDDNDVDGFVERLCIFEHICFDRTKKEFKFYRREDRPPRPVLFESRLGHVDTFHHGSHGFVATKQLFWADTSSGSDSFAPRIVPGRSPAVASPNATVRLSAPHALWSTWSKGDNLGHLLWEEMAGVWFAMLRMNVYSENTIAMHWPDDLPERALARKFRDAFFPAISSRLPVSFDPYMEQVAADPTEQVTHVCFDQLLVGGNVRRFLQRMAWHNYGQEPLFLSLRGRILERFGLSPHFIPKSHRIVIVHKSSSNWVGDDTYKTHRSIYNLDDVTAFVKTKYPRIDVKLVDFKECSVEEQLELLTSTTLLITPAGGISMLLPFLPDGANAIILDYLEKEDDRLIGTKVGHSVSMEAPFWNYWPHVKKLYYQVRSKGDLRPDDPSKIIDEVSWRDEASVMIELDRLEALLEMAFENMSP